MTRVAIDSIEPIRRDDLRGRSGGTIWGDDQEDDLRGRSKMREHARKYAKIRKNARKCAKMTENTRSTLFSRSPQQVLYERLRSAELLGQLTSNL